MSQEIFEKSLAKEFIQNHYKLIVTAVITLLFGVFMATNNYFFIFGTGKSVKIEVIEDVAKDSIVEQTPLGICYDGADLSDVLELAYFPKEVLYIVIHCDASLPHIKVDHKWYTETFAKKYGEGWRYGYHSVVDKSGKLIRLVQIDKDSILTPKEVAWGVAGMNSVCIHVAYSGGVDKNNKPKNTLTKSQRTTLIKEVAYYKSLFKRAEIVPHNKFNKHKACPSFYDLSFLR